MLISLFRLLLKRLLTKTKVVSNAEKTATATANKVADAQKKVDSLSTTTDTHELEKNEYTLFYKKLLLMREQ